MVSPGAFGKFARKRRGLSVKCIGFLDEFPFPTVDFL